MTQLLETHIVETGASPQWAVIWLHGLGADGFDFAPLVPDLVNPDTPAIRFVFPHAPVRPVTINNGYRMRAWYDITDMDFANRADLTGVGESIEQVEALIAAQIASGIPASNIVLAGFSQGGAIALSFLMKSSTELAGVIALSTYLPDLTNVVASAKPSSVPVFMAHGTMDPVVPFAAGEATYKAMSALGMDIAWRTYPMQHQVAMEEIVAIRIWLGDILTKKRAIV